MVESCDNSKDLIPIFFLTFGMHLLLEWRWVMSLFKQFWEQAQWNGRKGAQTFVEQRKESCAEDKREEEKGK